MTDDRENPGMVTDWASWVKLIVVAIAASTAIGVAFMAVLWVLAGWLV